MNAESLFDLQRLLDPVPLRDFLGSYWERQLLHLQRGQADYFRPLVEGCDLDRLIANSRSTPDHTLALIKDGVIAHQVADGVQRFGRGDALRLDRLDAETVYREHAAGATIRFTRLERHLTPLWRLAGEIERELSTDVSVNLYLTPPSSQGFAAHIDLHDALVLQVSGSKRWRIGEPVQELPVERKVKAHRQLYDKPFPFAAENQKGAAARHQTDREILLQAGDVLYIPRGVPHSAAAQDEASMHLTVGFTSLTWHELLIHAVTRRLGLERLLRTGLAPGFVTQPAVAQALAARSGELREAVQRALTPEWLAETARDLANRYVYSRRHSTYGQMEDLRRLPDLALDSEVEIRPGITARLEPRPDALYFFYSGRVLTLPDRVRGMLEFMLRKRRFQVAEIETELGEKSRLLLTKQLITEGFLGFARA